MKKLIIYILFLIPFSAFAQEETDSTAIATEEIVEVTNSVVTDSTSVDHLTFRNPMRAALYSAILPGAGQIYNKKWWKAPLVWGVLGAGTGFIIHLNNQHKEARGYYLDKLYGNPISEPGIANLSKEQLARIQDDRKRNRDYAIALTALGYILNILDATVDAHLYGINKDPDLSFQPTVIQNLNTNNLAMGFGVSYKF